MSYPSPCERCYKKQTCGQGCLDWKIRYLYRQKAINLYAKKVCRPPQPDNTKFRYLHPDERRIYLRHSPCEECAIKELCDTPCGVYLQWYDARMEWVRGRLKL